MAILFFFFNNSYSLAKLLEGNQLTPSAIAWAIPNLGALRAQRGLK